VLVPPITTARLELVSLTPEFMHASRAGRLSEAAALLGAALPADWPGEAEHVLRLRVQQLATDPSSQPWLLRAIVLRQPGRPMVGRIGFHAPPDERGAVEVGYAIVPAYRRQGYAHEAVTALFAWASREHGIRRFIASVSPTNDPSLRLVHKLGFTRVGTQWDDLDGEEGVFELVRAAPAETPDAQTFPP
jgi:[ribosomal protein S5]-alanine N-acetyltransferase